MAVVHKGGVISEGSDSRTVLPGHDKGRAEAKSEELQTVEVDDGNSVEIAILNP